MEKNTSCSPSSKKGALIVNLGTPERPDVSAVRAYLKQFLMDPLVLDIPFVMRWMIVHLAILPRRPKKSSSAYQKIWTDRGSPLLFHLHDLGRKVEKYLGSEWSLKAAMRYGQPSLEKAFQEFRQDGVSEVTLLPLYPQYSLSATESSVKAAFILAKMEPEIRLRVVAPFFKSNEFIDPFVQIAKDHLAGFFYDHILFSFHGLPERQVRKTESVTGHCQFSVSCCEKVVSANQNCYRAHCYETARQMAQKLAIPPTQYTVCFQSRLGRTPWIQPFTDELYRTLPQKGVRNLAVFCPSFVADCLETLEEIEIRGKAEFINNGGENLLMIPSLNSHDGWAKGVADLLQKSLTISV